MDSVFVVNLLKTVFLALHRLIQLTRCFRVIESMTFQAEVMGKQEVRV